MNAYTYAYEKHKGQYRKDGKTPYIKHPLGVAAQVQEVSNDRDILQAALLHDVVEDTETSIDEIRGYFGSVVAGLVGELTKDKDERERLNLGKREYTLYKMVTMSNKALIVKLCDRLENIKDLKNQPNEGFTDTYISNTRFILNNLVSKRAGKNLLYVHEQLIERIREELGQYGTNG